MTQEKTNALPAAVRQLRFALTTMGGCETTWVDDLYATLGYLAQAIQEEVQRAEETKANLDALNPDFQNAPVNERHVRSARKQFIQLGEQAHQLRADLQMLRATACLDAILFRQRCERICGAVEKVQLTLGEFFVETMNSNPGAGE
ncbi:MAG: hypothetical protein HYX68_21220 [Planctomycetes bacterium]|nr:hypothetical protein [Planctomycetota bacterium]